MTETLLTTAGICTSTVPESRFLVIGPGLHCFRMMRKAGRFFRAFRVRQRKKRTILKKSSALLAHRPARYVGHFFLLTRLVSVALRLTETYSSPPIGATSDRELGPI